MKKKDEIITLPMLYEIAKQYDNFSCKPENKKYKVGTIFDEEKSVRWNREEVEKRNKIHAEEVKCLNTEKNLLYEKFKFMAKTYIYQETDLSQAMAAKMFQYAAEHSNSTFDQVDVIDGLVAIFH